MCQEIPDELEIERFRTFVAAGKFDEPLQTQRWAKDAQDHITRLTRAVELLLQDRGGTLGIKIRQALEPAIIRQLNDRDGVVLNEGVERETFGVHVMPDHVVVDVRLLIGRAKVERAPR